MKYECWRDFTGGGCLLFSAFFFWATVRYFGLPVNWFGRQDSILYSTVLSGVLFAIGGLITGLAYYLIFISGCIGHL